MASVPQRLPEGRQALLRVAGPQDSAAIGRLYRELSAESFRSRFQTSRPADDLLARLAALAPEPEAAAVVAADPQDPERLVGEARYVMVGEDAAEFGLVVLDGYQGGGLGRLLLAELVCHARETGLARLRAVVSLQNAAMLRLLASYRWMLAEATDGFATASLEFSVVGGMPGWPPGTQGQRVLVERRGWFDNDRVAALREAGLHVRQCTGPRRQSGRLCPLVTSGRCRAAEEADLILPMLPTDDADCAAVLTAHRRRWPDRLAGDNGRPGRAGDPAQAEEQSR